MTGIFISETLHSVPEIVWCLLRKTESLRVRQGGKQACALSKPQELQMHPEHVYYQYNSNHNYHAGICSLQDKRLEESLCLDWAAKLEGRKHKI